VHNQWRRDIIVIGGSAGAWVAIRRLFELLPPKLPAAIFLTVHIPADFPSVLPELLSKDGRVARHPAQEQTFGPGDIFVAPPDNHLIIENSRVVLGHGPRENRHRPAIDVMFRSAARSYGPRVAGIVLSGQLDDGAAGLMSIKMAQGLAIVQDPREALAQEMPSRAIQYAQPDYVLPITEIAEMLISVSREDLPRPDTERKIMSDEIEREKTEKNPEQEKSFARGKPSAFACPECHGVLWEVDEGELTHYRCRVGHAYSGESLRVAFSESTEAALWVALRVVEERAALLRRLAQKAGPRISSRYEEEAAGFDVHAERLRKMLADSASLAANERGLPGAALETEKQKRIRKEMV
jgi:two-component system, chemotaxis family, protein-glutamate methylesterase/glutaminase